MTNYLHSEDKLPEESWSEYWNRKRREIHGEDCHCILCANELEGTNWHTPWKRDDENSDRKDQ